MKVIKRVRKTELITGQYILFQEKHGFTLMGLVEERGVEIVDADETTAKVELKNIWKQGNSLLYPFTVIPNTVTLVEL
ncbi:MAG TPA: hypothetical protein VH186_06325 [Chloroflexia bacterium]|nr:hypothetical protein [Chloroflexia bacterium]